MNTSSAMFKRIQVAVIVWSMPLALTAQEPSPQWSVEIPVPVADGQPSPPAAEPTPVDFEVLESHTTTRHVTEAPEMTGLPPVRGNINVTVQLVKDPQLADPQPLPPLPPEDRAIVGALAEIRENYQGCDLVFLSATVYDH